MADGFSQTVAVRDVKTMNSIKSLYLYFLLRDEVKRKALEIICGCGRQKVLIYYFEEGICYKMSLRDEAEREGLLGAQLSGVLTQTFAI